MPPRKNKKGQKQFNPNKNEHPEEKPPKKFNEDKDKGKRKNTKGIQNDNSNQNNSNKSSKIKIILARKEKGTLATTLEWNDNNNPFEDLNEKDLLKKIKKTFSTTCLHKNNSLIFNGDFTIRIKDCLINQYGVNENQIEIIQDLIKIPPRFTITLIEKKKSNCTEVKWFPLRWNFKKAKSSNGWKDGYYKSFKTQFFNAFKNKYNLPITNIIDRPKIVVYSISGDCTNTLIDYFTKEWDFPRNKIFVESDEAEPVPQFENLNHQIIDPLNTMKEKFDSLPKSSYFNKMSKTIIDYYEYQKQRLGDFVIQEQLEFIKSGSDDKEYTFWATSFDISKKVTIEGIQAGRFVSEGDDVLIEYKNGKFPLLGKVESIKNGIVTTSFKIKTGLYPPGYSKEKEKWKEADEDDIQIIDDEEIYDQKDENNNNDDDDDDEEESVEEEEEEDKNDLNDDDNEEEETDDDFKDIYEEDDYDTNNKKGNLPYSIKFIPSDVTYKRCALGLLNLYNMDHLSSIKNIITKEKLDRSLNIIDESIDEEIDPQYSEYIDIDITNPQEESIEMVLENQISIVHGPPGCGKTSLIALFAYHLLQKQTDEKKKILLCAYSNQAVENIVKCVSPLVKKLGKKIVWIPKKSMHFDNLEQFNNATEEQQALSFYQILKRNSREAGIYQKLQYKKWNISSQLKKYYKLQKIGHADPNLKVKPFPVSEQHEMDKIQFLIEKNLIDEADVVCCTLISSARSNMVDFDFDYIFVDEASQADQMVSLIPLIHHPSKIVLLGDHRQLDAHIPYELKKRHPDTTQSLYKKLLLNGIQHVMLKTQFRMNPKIAEFPNKEFYNGVIKNADGMEEKTHDELSGINLPIMFVDVKDGKEKKVYGSTFINIKELETIEILLNNMQKNSIDGSQVGIITPYHGQVEKIRRIIEKLKYDGARASCVDNFQGSERDFIIFSLVRTNENGNFGFLPNKKRINVSLTRARKGMIIVGNFNAFVSKNSCRNPQNQVLVDLCNFYRENDAVVDSKKIEKIIVLVQKPKTKKKLDIKMHNKKDEQKTSSQKDDDDDDKVRKVDKYAEDLFEYDDDDDDENDNDDDKNYLLK